MVSDSLPLPWYSSNPTTSNNYLWCCRLSGPNMIKIMMLLMMGIAVIVDGRPTAQEDIQMNCPSHCVCKLFPMPGVYCSGYMSLPGVIPRSARLFNCTGCNIVRITNKSLENYRHLTHLIFAGSSPLVIDGLSPQFLRSVQYLELEGYEISQNDILRLIADNRTLVLKNISLTFSNASVPLADTPTAGASSKSPTSSVEEDGLVTKEGAVDGSPSIPATAEGGDIDTIPSEASQDRDATPISHALEEKYIFSASNNDFIICILVIAVVAAVLAVVVLVRRYRNNNSSRRDYEQVTLTNAYKISENVLDPASNTFSIVAGVAEVAQQQTMPMAWRPIPKFGMSKCCLL